LNVSTAAAICLFETMRVRRSWPSGNDLAQNCFIRLNRL
jgi:hypothetical protein